MKKEIHPEWKETTVMCNGCGTTFKTKSAVDKITVEICSNCHPFYTGKQKLVDIAGRVDKFKARQAAATDKQAKAKPKVAKKTAAKKTSPAKLQELKTKLEKKTPAQP